MFNVKGKSVLISGASRGIGRAVAKACHEAGMHVFAGVRNEKDFAALKGEGLKPVMLDVTSRAQFAEIIQDVRSQFGRLDVLINNAGIASNKPASGFSEEDTDRMIDTNFKGVFNGMQAYYKTQRKEGGTIINMASLLGIVGTPLASIYCGTKGAVIQMTRALALEWASSGFRVNAIAPGFIDTDMTEMMKKRESVMQSVLKNIPLKRLGNPDDITGAVLFLASSASSYITGQVIVIDGGTSVQ